MKLKRITNGKRFLQSVDRYVDVCKSEDRLPNLAGFLRFTEMTLSEYSDACERFPRQAELAQASFEDEALNSGTKKISASVLNLYLKSRFGYGSDEKSEQDGALNVICDHPDGEDE